MKKQRCLLFLMLCFLSADISVAAPIKISIFLPFSGIYKNIGQSSRNGFILGLEEEAKQLHTTYKGHLNISLIDSKADPLFTMKKMNQEIANGTRCLLGFVSSAVAHKVHTYIMNNTTIPMIVFGAAGTPQIRTDSPRFLRFSFSNYHAPIGLGLWSLLNPVNPDSNKKWICIYADYEAGIEVCDGFKHVYQIAGDELKRIPVPFKKQIEQKHFEQLLDADPSLVIAFFAGREARDFVQGFYKYKGNRDIPLLIPGFATTENLLKEYTKTITRYKTGIGMISAIHWHLLIPSKANKIFVRAYRAKFSQPPTVFAVQGYDAGRNLVKALYENQWKWDTISIITAMRKSTIVSPRHNKPLRFDSMGDPIQPEYILQTIKWGKKLVNRQLGETQDINLDRYQIDSGL